MKPLPKPSITEVFEHYGATVLGSNSGGWQKATCALNDHEDGSPSASVNEDGCRWKCFSCNKGGDALDLIQENENVGWADSIKLAEGFAGGGNGPVRAERGSTGLLPGRARSKSGSGTWTPPWAGF